MSMEREKIQYWVLFLITVVVAVIAANWIAALVIIFTGLGGVTAFVVNFIVFALAFFGIIALAGRITGINIFGCAP